MAEKNVNVETESSSSDDDDKSEYLENTVESMKKNQEFLEVKRKSILDNLAKGKTIEGLDEFVSMMAAHNTCQSSNLKILYETYDFMANEHLSDLFNKSKLKTPKFIHKVRNMGRKLFKRPALPYDSKIMEEKYEKLLVNVEILKVSIKTINQEQSIVLSDGDNLSFLKTVYISTVELYYGGPLRSQFSDSFYYLKRGQKRIKIENETLSFVKLMIAENLYDCMEGSTLKLEFEIDNKSIEYELIKNLMISKPLGYPFQTVAIETNIVSSSARNASSAWRYLILTSQTICLLNLNGEEKFSIELTSVKYFETTKSEIQDGNFVRIQSVLEDGCLVDEPLNVVLEAKTVEPFKNYFESLKSEYINSLADEGSKRFTMLVQSENKSLGQATFDVERTKMGFWRKKYLSLNSSKLSIDLLDNNKEKTILKSIRIDFISKILCNPKNKKEFTVHYLMGSKKKELRLRAKDPETCNKIIQLLGPYMKAWEKIKNSKNAKSSTIHSMNEKNMLSFEVLKVGKPDIYILGNTKLMKDFIAVNMVNATIDNDISTGLLELGEAYYRIKKLNIVFDLPKNIIVMHLKNKLYKKAPFTHYHHICNDLSNPHGLRFRNPDGSFLGIHFESINDKELIKSLLSHAIYKNLRVPKASIPARKPLKIFCGSWNTGESKPTNIIEKTWLVDSLDHDIIAIGFQEADNNAFVKTISDFYAKTHKCILTISMWQMSLTIFAKIELEKIIGNVHTESKPTGIAQVIGNKGGVQGSFSVMDTSFCFINSHLAAGATKIHLRKNNFYEIVKNMRSHPKNHEQISVYNYVFWMGDFNYRLNLPFEQVADLANKGEFTELHKYDQLMEEMKINNVFYSFKEGQLNFKPTYRRLRKSNAEWSNKNGQSPSWTDRIMYKSHPHLNLELIKFTSYEECFGSDHRPVSASFNAEYDVYFIPEKVEDIFPNNIKSSIIVSNVTVELQAANLSKLKDVLKFDPTVNIEYNLNFELNKYIFPCSSAKAAQFNYDSSINMINLNWTQEQIDKLEIIHFNKHLLNTSCFIVVIETSPPIIFKNTELAKKMEVIFGCEKLNSQTSTFPIGYAHLNLSTIKNFSTNNILEGDVILSGVLIGKIIVSLSFENMQYT